jgi:ribosome biogenesis protein Nip4
VTPKSLSCGVIQIVSTYVTLVSVDGCVVYTVNARTSRKIEVVTIKNKNFVGTCFNTTRLRLCQVSLNVKGNLKLLKHKTIS